MSELVQERPLHPAQRDAAEAPEAIIAVLAGPGSGKTRTLSARARFLLTRDAGSNALLLTFMNKAAAEMKARCLSNAPFSPERIWAGTFHAFCARMLRDHSALVGVSSDFDVLDADDAKDLAASAGGSEADLFRYDRVRSARTPMPAYLEDFAEAYEAAKADEDALDFTDLVVRGAELLEDHPQVASSYGRYYSHLLVDEFQDTDASRFAIVRALAPHVATISMFADDDQAIMSFAGADRANVDRFVAELGARRIALTVNYRSRSAIVAAANKLIAADPGCSGRAMTADQEGGVVRSRCFEDEGEEALGVAALITDRLTERQPEDIAVLARTRWHADAVAAALLAAGVPLSDWRADIVDGRARRSVSACLAVLRPTIAGRHEAVLCEMAGIPRTRLRDTGAMLEALGNHPVGRALAEIRRAAFRGAGVVDLVDAVCALVETQRPELTTDVDRVRQAVRAFADHDSGFGLEHLLTELALGAGAQGPTVGGGIKLATLHRTKGLQWPVVVIIGMTQGGLPYYKADTPLALSEERRLCFVGVSRAEEELILTRPESTKGQWRPPSQFLAEMDL